MSTLDSILAQLNDEAVTMKTASDNSPAPVSNEDAALEAVRAATKIASAQAPQTNSGDAVAALHKIAAETAAMEDAMMAKQAQDYGALVCDGFMQRLAQYDGAFGTDKTASAGVSQADLEKVAQAAYAQGAQDFEKNAAAQYEAGYNETMAQVHKIASDLHISGQATARQVVAALSGQKTAGVADTALSFMTSPRAAGGAALEALAANPRAQAALAGSALGAGAGALAGGEDHRLSGALGGAALGGLGGYGLQPLVERGIMRGANAAANRAYPSPSVLGEEGMDAAMDAMSKRVDMLGAARRAADVGAPALAGLGAAGAAGLGVGGASALADRLGGGGGAPSGGAQG